jgi:putative DNA primase/helicase
MGNAERFIRHHGQNVKYCYAWGKWLCWKGQRWQIDEKDEVIQLVQNTMRLFRDQVQIADAFDWAQDDQARSKTHKEASAWATQSQARRKILDALELAKSDPAIAVGASDLDRHRHLLNCPNGTLNLHTGELYPHRREDLLTKITRGSYVPKATHPFWKETLKTFQPDVAMRSFLQRFLGSSLEGGNPHKKLGFGYGPENSGKTTIFGTLVYAMGDYAATTGVETFAERRDQGHSLNEMARFMGKRLIYAEEISDGLRLSQGMVKRITGGANLLAKVLYQNTFEFSLEFTLFLAANDYPLVSSTDDPIWDRLVPILFPHTIPAVQRQDEARDLLKTDPEALTAVLTWAVEGYFAY